MYDTYAPRRGRIEYVVARGSLSATAGWEPWWGQCCDPCGRPCRPPGLIRRRANCGDSTFEAANNPSLKVGKSSLSPTFGKSEIAHSIRTTCIVDGQLLPVTIRYPGSRSPGRKSTYRLLLITVGTWLRHQRDNFCFVLVKLPYLYAPMLIALAAANSEPSKSWSVSSA